MEPLVSIAIDRIAKAVHEHRGMMDIELLGRVTQMYSPTDSSGVSYPVLPNASWKV